MVEATCELELGLDLELVCNVTLKDVKKLKHQRGRKGSEYVWLDEEGSPDIFDDWHLAKEPNQVLLSEDYWVQHLVLIGDE